jgi:hypothetical protein
MLQQHGLRELFLPTGVTPGASKVGEKAGMPLFHLRSGGAWFPHQMSLTTFDAKYGEVKIVAKGL